MSPIPGRNSVVALATMVGTSVRVGVGGNHKIVGVVVFVGVELDLGRGAIGVTGRQALSDSIKLKNNPTDSIWILLW